MRLVLKYSAVCLKNKVGSPHCYKNAGARRSRALSSSSTKEEKSRANNIQGVTVAAREGYMQTDIRVCARWCVRARQCTVCVCVRVCLGGRMLSLGWTCIQVEQYESGRQRVMHNVGAERRENKNPADSRINTDRLLQHGAMERQCYILSSSQHRYVSLEASAIFISLRSMYKLATTWELCTICNLTLVVGRCVNIGLHYSIPLYVCSVDIELL